MTVQDYVNENIPRLIEQIKSGDRAMSFMAIYSFIEGYGRIKYPQFAFNSGGDKDVNFPKIMDKISEKWNDIKNWYSKSSNLKKSLISYYGSWKDTSYNSPTTANKIRHTFDKLSDETFLCTAVYQLDKFAENEKFADDSIGKLKELLENEKVFSFWRKNELRNSITQTDLPDDFYEKIPGNLSESEKYEKLCNEVEELRKSISSGNIKPTDYSGEVGKLVNKQQELEKIDLSLVGSGFAYRNQLINERTRRNYKTELIALSDEQNKILGYVENNFLKKDGNPKDMLIVGGPGTGKTLTLICILIKFVLSGRQTVLLTYYDSLNKYIKYLFELYNNFDKKIYSINLNPADVKNLQKDNLQAFDKFMFHIFKRLGGLEFNTLQSKKDECKNFINAFLNQSEKDAYKIAATEVWPNMKSEAEFCGNDSNKSDIWKLIQEIERKFLSQKTDNQGLKTVPDVFAYYYFNKIFSNQVSFSLVNYKKDFIIIDESQDLTNAQIAAVKKLATNCFFAGDMNQSIRNPKVSWTKLGLDVIGGQYSRTLKDNFRSTKEIQEIGQTYLEYCSVKEKVELKPQGNGPKPKMFVVDRQNLYTNLVNAVKFYMDASQDLDDICVVAFSDSELDDIWCVFDDYGIKSYRILNDDYDFNGQQPAVRLSTVENIKGIDCVHLFFVADSDKASEKESKISNENLPNAIFTCITRAMCSLQVFMVNCNPINPALENLMEVMGKKKTPLVKPVSQPQAQNTQSVSVPEIKSKDDIKSPPLVRDSSKKTVVDSMIKPDLQPQVKNVQTVSVLKTKSKDDIKSTPLVQDASSKNMATPVVKTDLQPQVQSSRSVSTEKKEPELVAKRGVQASTIVKRLGNKQELKDKTFNGFLVESLLRKFTDSKNKTTSYKDWKIEGTEFSNSFITKNGNRFTGLKEGDNVQFKVWSVTDSGDATVDIIKKLN